MTTSPPELLQEQPSNPKDGNDEKPVAEVPSQVVDSAQGTESLSPKTATKVDISESLRELKGIIETATCYEDELSDLLERCHATVEQFEEPTAVAQQGVELQELHDVINSAKDVAKLCNEDSPFWRMGHHFKISNELRLLEARTVSREPVDKPNTARRHPAGAKLPVGAPRIHAWHIERTEIIDAVCDQLGAISDTDRSDEKACLVGIAGPPGSGKSIAASMVIARESVRASFTKGVLWLPAGPGPKDRLPLLMYRLAEMVYETVKRWEGKAPRVPDIGVDSEDGAAYVREAIGGDLHRLLIVVDDVWESDVLQELRSTGASILYTTRSDRLIGNALLRLDKVDIHEAEILLRGAAELGDNANLPREAHKLAKRCGSSIMDLAFIGRWSVVRGRKDGRGWQKAIDLVVRAQKEGKGDTKPPWSTAVLRAGLDELVRNEEIREFYLSMALMPKGFAFTVEDAAALLYGGYCPQEILKEVRQKVTILESMAIVAQHVGGMYRMHVSHAEFVQEEITKFPETYERTKVRWQEYVSSINALLSWPQDDLLLVQRVLGAPDKDAGASVFDATIDMLSESDPRLPKALRRVAYIQWMNGDREVACSKWSRLLVIHENMQLDVEYPYVALTLYDIGLYLENSGREKEAETWFEQALSIGEKQLGSNQLQLANGLHRLANRSVSMDQPDNAEGLYRRALAIREVKLGDDHPDVAATLHGLGICKLMLGKSRGAKGHLQRALAIYKNKLSAYHSEVGRVLYDLGRCASIDGRVEDAEHFYRGALDIQKSDETTDGTLADTLYALGGCMSEIGCNEEAEGLYRRALVMRVNILPNDHLDVARVVYALGKCTLELRRAKEAEALCRRALVAVEKTTGDEHPAVADILHTLGICAIVEERTASGTELLKRALSIYQQQPSVDDSKVAHVTYDLGRCTAIAGQTKEAEQFFRQTLEIEECLQADRLEVATVLYALGGCVLMGGQIEEAEDLYRRASVIRVGTLGTNHADVADGLNALGNCLLLAGGRVIEAKTLFRRALDIKKGFLPPNDPEIQAINHALEMCQIDSSEIVDTEESKWGAEAICLC